MGTTTDESAGKRAGGTVIMIVGVLVEILGVVLYGGNKGGFFPTFPFAGGITMLLGAWIISVGFAMAGKLTAIVFGTMIMLTGIGMYVAGSTIDTDLFKILFRLGGVFVGAIGGGLVAMGTGLLK